MKTKNTSCLWMDTACLPRKSDWSFNYKKRTRPNRKSNPVDVMPTVQPIENQIIKGEITLESLGLCFDASMQRKSIHA